MSANTVNAIRLPAALAVLALLVLWETLGPFLPLYGGRPHATRERLLHGGRHLAIGLVNGAVARFGFLGAWIATMEWSREYPFGVLHWIALPDWVGWTAAILLLDSWTYAWHRLNHAVPGLWRFHRLHHSDRQMDATTANRFHLGEIVLSSIARVPVLALIGCGIMIRVLGKPIGPALRAILASGSTPELEAQVARGFSRTRPFVLAIWVLLVAAAWVGIAKPEL